MHPFLHAALETFFIVAVWELLLGFTYQLVSRTSTSIADRCARAPIVDVLLALITWVPWIWACVFAGWIGLIASILAEVAALYLWCFVHEMIHRDAARGPRI